MAEKMYKIIKTEVDDGSIYLTFENELEVIRYLKEIYSIMDENYLVFLINDNYMNLQHYKKQFLSDFTWIRSHDDWMIGKTSNAQQTIDVIENWGFYELSAFMFLLKKKEYNNLKEYVEMRPTDIIKKMKSKSKYTFQQILDQTIKIDINKWTDTDSNIIPNLIHVGRNIFDKIKG
jgi:asparagine N-glycosylation enzyme membrane subunit Stt3